MAAVKDAPVIKLTLDANLQKVLEPLARDRAIALGQNISVGDHRGRQCERRRARPGRLGRLFRFSRAGQVDMTRAVRSPGSTLKPFIYGLAFEDGFVHPDSLIDDRPIRFGSYAPENFDMTYQGTVPVKQGAPTFLERAGDRAARPRRLEPAVVAAAAGRRQSGAAKGRGAGTRDGSRRRRRHTCRIWRALRRVRRGSAPPNRCARSWTERPTTANRGG